jgi:hypothetical protein
VRIYPREVRSLEAPLGQPTCWAIGFPPEGLLTYVRVKQVGGTPVGFTFTTYSSELACRDGSQSSGGADADGEYASDPDMYEVHDAVRGQAGQPGTFNEPTGVTWRNQDGTFTSPVRLIYIQITPDASGGDQSATWDVALRGIFDIG